MKFRGWLELETPEAWPYGLLTHATAEPVTGEIDGNAFGMLTHWHRVRWSKCDFGANGRRFVQRARCHCDPAGRAWRGAALNGTGLRPGFRSLASTPATSHA